MIQNLKEQTELQKQNEQEVIVNFNFSSSLGISEIKLMGMGELNSDDNYIYYSGQESLRRKGQPTPVSLPEKI